MDYDCLRMWRPEWLANQNQRQRGAALKLHPCARPGVVIGHDRCSPCCLVLGQLRETMVVELHVYLSTQRQRSKTSWGRTEACRTERRRGRTVEEQTISKTMIAQVDSYHKTRDRRSAFVRTRARTKSGYCHGVGRIAHDQKSSGALMTARKSNNCLSRKSKRRSILHAWGRNCHWIIGDVDHERSPGRTRLWQLGVRPW